MSAEFQSIDDQIKASYQSASQVETQARQLEARIAKIDGAKRHLPSRRYGQPVDMAKIRSNLTLTSLIAQDSAELAHFCGIDPAIRHRIDEEKEARARAAQSSASSRGRSKFQWYAPVVYRLDMANMAAIKPASLRAAGAGAPQLPQLQDR